MQYLYSILTFAAIWAILVLSLNILLGYGGQVSIGHAAFFGIGAYTGAVLATRYGVDLAVTIPAAMLITSLAGALLGLPSLRVRHDFLVLATIGLNFIVVGTLQYVDFFGGALGISNIPGPSIFGLEMRGLAYLLFCLGAMAVTAWVNGALPKTWGGLGLLTLKDDEAAAASVGVNQARYKITAFAISGAFAGLGGALYAPFVGNVFPDRFGFLESITLVSMLVFGGIGTVRGAVFGAVVLKSLPEYLRFGGQLRFALYGAVLLLSILFLPEGVLGERSAVWLWLKRTWRRFFGSRQQDPGKKAQVRAANGRSAPAESVLTAHNITVDFGGLRALDDVSIEVRTGEIVGLIGPNGAGKSTLFMAITGFVPITQGRVLLNGVPMQRLPPHRRAQKGIARTFQIVRPFGSLDVRRNILSGLGIRHYPHLAAFLRKQHRETGQADHIARRTLLEGREQMRAQEMPIGLLRQLEVARALGTDAAFFLLDEPAAGLTHDEVDDLRRLVLDLKQDGRGVLLVEHNMRFAMEVCDRIVVLTAGKVLAQGSPEEIQAHPEVIEAYLGAPL